MEPARVASAIGFMLNAYELFTSFPDEVEFVWMNSDQMTPSKWFYLYARYSVFIVHLQHYHYAPRYQNMDPTKPAPSGLTSWMLYKFFFWQTLVYGTDIVLCKRAYYMYNKNESIRCFLYSILFSRTLLVVIACYVTLTTLRIGPPTGRDSLTFKVAGHYIGGELLIQSIIITMAFSRAIRKGPIRVFTVLSESGPESCIGLILLVLGMFVYSFGYKISVFIYPVSAGILSTIVCRLILNTHRAQRIR